VRLNLILAAVCDIEQVSLAVGGAKETSRRRCLCQALKRAWTLALAIAGMALRKDLVV